MTLEREGVSKFVKDKDGAHRLKRMDPLPIAFFKNGLILKGFPFMPYHANDGQQVMADILEGYFPHQLKKSFPDGVLLKLLDRIEEKYNPESLDNHKIFNLQNIDDMALKPMSKEEFLDKLPKNVIKNGKVLPIQAEIAKHLVGGIGAPTASTDANEFGEKLIRNDVLEKLEQNTLTDEEKDEIVTLKIRTETSKAILIIKVFSDALMSQLYQLVEPHAETKAFLIASTFPNQTYARNESQNMKELGFYPNSALFLKAEGKPNH